MKERDSPMGSLLSGLPLSDMDGNEENRGLTPGFNQRPGDRSAGDRDSRSSALTS